MTGGISSYPDSNSLSRAAISTINSHQVKATKLAINITKDKGKLSSTKAAKALLTRSTSSIGTTMFKIPIGLKTQEVRTIIHEALNNARMAIKLKTIQLFHSTNKAIRNEVKTQTYIESRHQQSDLFLRYKQHSWYIDVEHKSFPSFYN